MSYFGDVDDDLFCDIDFTNTSIVSPSMVEDKVTVTKKPSFTPKRSGLKFKIPNKNTQPFSNLPKNTHTIKRKHSLLANTPLQIIQQQNIPKPLQFENPNIIPKQNSINNTTISRLSVATPKVSNPVILPKSKLIKKANSPQIDTVNSKYWIYPINLPKRDYQFNIVKTCLYSNTLVCLPTGLGKTFIAGVIMYNYFRWFPKSKIVFMAPTKPLVSQQMEAFQKYVPVPSQNILQMTGQVPPSKRKKYWEEKRILFITPQILNNDITKEICDPSNIVCLIIDEAHQAQGNYAYCTVVKKVFERTNYIRVIGLTASPGSGTKSIQQVLTNLRISKMEVRTDDSIDVRPYIHHRKIDIIQIPMSDTINELAQLLLTLLETPIEYLFKSKAFFRANPSGVTSYQLIKAKKTFSQRSRNTNMNINGMIDAYFNICISLFQCYQLLLSHGILTFSKRLEKFYEESTKGGSTRKKLISSPDFVRLRTALQKIVGDCNSLEKKKQMHPKFGKIGEILENHFKDNGGCFATRVMIFCQYRDTVMEIVDIISSLNVVPKAFLGQSGNKSTKGMSQKEQQEVLAQFKEGVFNTLVSTCIGEEGLDIGEVDLIVCFDTQTSPTRIIQRMGRTGRKRDGRCVILLTEGSEVKSYKSSESKKKSIFKTLNEKRNSFNYYLHDEKIVPKTVPKSPKFIKDDIIDNEIIEENNEETNFNNIEDEDEDNILLCEETNNNTLPSKEDVFCTSTTSIILKNTKRYNKTEKQPLIFYPFETRTKKISHNNRCNILLNVFKKFSLTNMEYISNLKNNTNINNIEKEEEKNMDLDMSSADISSHEDSLNVIDCTIDHDNIYDLITSSPNDDNNEISTIIEQQQQQPPLKVSKQSKNDTISNGTIRKTSTNLSAFAKWSYNTNKDLGNENSDKINKNKKNDNENFPKPLPVPEILRTEEEGNNNYSIFSPSPTFNSSSRISVSPIQKNIVLSQNLKEKNDNISQEDIFAGIFPSPVAPPWGNQFSPKKISNNNNNTFGNNLVTTPPKFNINEISPKTPEKSFLITPISPYDSSSDIEDLNLSNIISQRPLNRLQKKTSNSSSDLPKPSTITPPLKSIEKNYKKSSSSKKYIHQQERKYFLDSEANCDSEYSSDEEDSNDSSNLSFIVSQVSPEKRNMLAIYQTSLLSEASQQQLKQSFKKSKKKPLLENNLQNDQQKWFGNMSDELLDSFESPNNAYFLSKSPQNFMREVSSSSSST